MKSETGKCCPCRSKYERRREWGKLPVPPSLLSLPSRGDTTEIKEGCNDLHGRCLALRFEFWGEWAGLWVAELCVAFQMGWFLNAGMHNLLHQRKGLMPSTGWFSASSTPKFQGTKLASFSYLPLNAFPATSLGHPSFQMPSARPPPIPSLYPPRVTCPQVISPSCSSDLVLQVSISWTGPHARNGREWGSRGAWEDGSLLLQKKLQCDGICEWDILINAKLAPNLN